MILIIFLYLYKRYYLIENFNSEPKKKSNLIYKKEIVLILGEQYWFENKKEYIVRSSILLNALNGMKKYKVIISNNPIEFFNKIKKLDKKRIKLIFLFQDIIGDSFLNKININTMYKYLINLRKKYKIIFYPGIEETNYFSSKKYYHTLLNKMYYSVLPHTHVLEIKKFIKSDLTFLLRRIKFICDKLIKKFDNIVIKKGYSYNSIQVAIIDKEEVDSIDKLSKTLLSLEKKDSFDITDNALKWELDTNRIYIIQGYNNIINESDFGEYRVFFIDGKPKYISWGDDFPNLCIDDVQKQTIFKYNINDNDTSVNNLLNLNNGKSLNIIDPEISKYVIKFAKKVYSDFIKIFWKKKNKVKHPIIFRIDISWTSNKHFQDSNSVYLKNSKKRIRLYVNELEIDPTHFFYNNFICKRNNLINSANIQREVSKLIINYIRKN